MCPVAEVTSTSHPACLDSCTSTPGCRAAVYAEGTGLCTMHGTLRRDPGQLVAQGEIAAYQTQPGTGGWYMIDGEYTERAC